MESGGGGGGLILPSLAILGAVGAGTAYYNDLISGLEGDSSFPQQKLGDAKEKTIILSVEEKNNADLKDDPSESNNVSKEITDAVTETAKSSLDESTSTTSDSDNGESQSEKAATFAFREMEHIAATTEPTESTPKTQFRSQTDETLSEAHSELAKLSSINVMSDEIDSLTETQLKVRLIQMAKDLEERNKWEAVRLKEFLSMKEKEVEDRYVLLIKRLRMEAENLLEEKLTLQRKSLTTEAEEALKEQLSKSESFLEKSMSIQEKAHEEDKIAFEAKIEEAIGTRYEEMYANSISKIKDEFAAKMSQRTQQMDQLSKKLKDLESSLKTSQDFQVGSLQAHRITAASIALIEKLNSGEKAEAAVNALEAVASDNAVVSAAVKALPAAVSNSGLLTIQELQASFEEKVFPQCRRAANIPDGQTGLEGQLLGSFFSTIRFPPYPDDPAPESKKDSSEYVLSRARRYVKFGELEKAVLELDKLKGQAAFVVKDWKAHAKDRIAVEKSLKVIKLECALANENLSKGAA